MLLSEAEKVLKNHGYSVKKTFEQVVKKLDLQQVMTDDEVLESQIAMEYALRIIWNEVGEFEIVRDKYVDEWSDLCEVKFVFVNNPKIEFTLSVEGDGENYVISRIGGMEESDDFSDIIKFLTK